MNFCRQKIKQVRVKARTEAGPDFHPNFGWPGIGNSSFPYTK